MLERNASFAVSAIRSLRNMTSPVHRLPSDVLGLIFEILVRLETPSSYLPRLSYTHTVTIESASHVCRRWREAALAYPNLWNTVYRGRSLTYPSIERSN